MWTEPTLAERTAQPYAAIRVRVPMPEIAQVVPPLNGEVFGWLAEHGGKPTGPPFWKYNVIDMERELEIEAGVTVESAINADDRVRGGVLPAGTYATLTNTGHPDSLMEATAALLAYGNERGWSWDRTDDPDGDRWGCRLEFYLTDPDEEPDLTKWQTELVFRLRDGSPG
ncbi:GyrI-like domain-containing protein [Microlunatus elymi]|uniref:GyrI-like domain-containing protein n=1 Tax=Microlunatus elymi TaxID=2596828 RepID=A0A516PXN7_9ACTN|nr:GyrI-like domain-containing protein [Microlunatus elymi]QDP95940.1 GyrI-like domain-containing protein [Microlunatus elymi]